MLGYFKYFNFLGELFTMAAGGEWLKMNIFLPVGISFFTFQSISYVIDVYRGRIQPLGRWIDYVFYVSFFPNGVALRLFPSRVWLQFFGLRCRVPP